MAVAATEAKRVPTLRLNRDLRRVVRRGHPWLYRDVLSTAPRDLAPGSIVAIADKQGKPLARGFYDPDGTLAVRVCSTERNARLDRAWALAGLERAVRLRERVIDRGTTSGWRAVNGEGDGLPGLVCDVYGDRAVIKLDGPICERFWDAPAVATWLAERLDLTAVYQRFRTREGPRGRPLVGDTPNGTTWFREHGAALGADLVNGQKTGFFLDQRENRRRVGRLAAGLRTLNVFGYTGGFSIYAGLGGARHVTTVDLAQPALDHAVANWAANDLAAEAHAAACQDAFAFLEAAAADRERWGLVVLDPPSFAPSHKAAGRALGSYTRLAAAGARVTSPGGLLVCCSCSAHVSADAFLGACADGVGQARRQAQVVGIHGQPADHPAPLACPELRYLKAVTLRLDGGGPTA